MAARKRAAVYLRVSTEEQTLDNQRADIKRVLRSRRLRQVASFEEQVSAARARPEFDAMMEAAHRGEFDVIVVSSPSSRQRLAAHFAVLAELNDDRWPSMPPSRALADLEMDEATLLDHLAAIERMLLRRHQ